ncbi:hypothetical protein N7509_003781 [Penicillium cosmopolitanum]|uniref:Transcription factor domain-containing protein n=1 Tax=Penicillium cosmopolitanum TaxID=1131564 RepID=A0A9W9W5Q4_9EURO|nr:uncharacterized protein N7509_003781 [Penicillium cosmopolitanum]KAJ5403910.1 hypothetical protein N7509_003781 [Penicillium cosmopolitanum]
MAEFYHFESVHMLLDITGNIEDVASNGEPHDELLAAICLLRSFEIISPRAAFWNYLREDITVALIERRKLMIELSEEHVPKNPSTDDEYANAVTILLGQVINQCFGEEASPPERLLLLESNLQTWKDSLPHSFTPILNRTLVKKGEKAFPFMGTLHGWHAAAIQYYQTAMIILRLAKPSQQAISVMDNLRQVTELTRELESRSSDICALALSSESQAVWINSFGPIAFCGCWLRDRNKFRDIISGVKDWGSRTGWPVSDIIKSLQESSS